jgi:hypothetical protein
MCLEDEEEYVFMWQANQNGSLYYKMEGSTKAVNHIIQMVFMPKTH